MVKYEKMSKSRGNVVMVDEVVFGIQELDRECEFCDKDGNLIEDYKKFEIWRDKLGDGMFYSSKRFGKFPVYLRNKNTLELCTFLINGKEVLQHGG